MPAAEPTGEDAGDLLTSEQVMDCLLAHAKLRKLASTCVLPGVKVGTEWRFRRSDLEAWIETQTAVHDRTGSAAD
jgi:excisionase family DNA binding protein